MNYQKDGLTKYFAYSKNMDKLMDGLERHYGYGSKLFEGFKKNTIRDEIIKGLEHDFLKNTQLWIEAFAYKFGYETGDFNLECSENDVYLQDDDRVKKLVKKLKKFGFTFKDEENLYNIPDDEFIDNRVDLVSTIAHNVTEAIDRFANTSAHEVIAEVLWGSYTYQWQCFSDQYEGTKTNYGYDGQNILAEILYLYKVALREHNHLLRMVDKMNKKLKLLNFDADFYNLPKIEHTFRKPAFKSKEIFLQDDGSNKVPSILTRGIVGLGNDRVLWQFEDLYRDNWGVLKK